MRFSDWLFTEEGNALTQEFGSYEFDKKHLDIINAYTDSMFGTKASFQDWHEDTYGCGTQTAYNRMEKGLGNTIAAAEIDRRRELYDSLISKEGSE